MVGYRITKYSLLEEYLSWCVERFDYEDEVFPIDARMFDLGVRSLVEL